MNLDKARENLERALEKIPTFEPEKLGGLEMQQISDVILGSHLTFRYILITALLGKVTDPSIHMRSLQAGADLPGAYDARSLCHKVWVPFERSKLNNKLGGSNEPFLNKPARFPAVDKTNAVRKGNDQRLLFMMYDLLEGLNDQDTELHEEAFIYAMSRIARRSSGLVDDIFLPEVRYTQVKTKDFIKLFLSECHGGESAAAAAGAVLRELYSKQGIRVIVHPANQAGTSSNEIGDIDLWQKKDLIMAVEVKDKKFAESDINHAIRKVIESRNRRLLFLVGDHALPTSRDIDFKRISYEYAEKGADVSFENLSELCFRMISLFSEEERKDVIFKVAAILDEMRATDVTKDHFQQCLKRIR
jgi:hypothetical protein